MLLRVKEVADKYNVTIQTVYNWIREGLKHKTDYVPGSKPFVVIDLKDIEEFHKEKKGEK